MGDNRHGAIHYPDSGMYARPYFYYYGSGIDGGRAALCDLKNALMEFGTRFIGHPWDICCDIDHPNAHKFFHPFYSEEEKIFRSPARLALKLQLGPAGAAALDGVVQKINTHVDRQKGQSVHFPYDADALGADLQALWTVDFLLDPRLLHAEDLFFNCPEGGALQSYDYSDGGEGRLNATLRWMQANENARRVARAFLYSRLARHVDVFGDTLLPLTIYIARQMDKGDSKQIVKKLRTDPDLLVREMRDANDTGGNLSYLFQNNADSSVIERRETLAASARRIALDYHALRSGRWAAHQRTLISAAPAPRHIVPA